MIFHTYIVLLLCICFETGLSLDAKWVLRPVPRLESDPYFSDIKFNSTEDVIKGNRIRIKKWMTDQAIPGFVTGIKIKGKTVWSEAFGFIDIENNVTTDKNSIWRLASVSKPLTTALVGQLIDRGLLDLNASIYKYISEKVFPKKTFSGKPVDITLRQLLSHTAGLHMTEVEKDFNLVYRAYNVTQSIVGLKNENLVFEPGEMFSYSNYGFQLVGAIIESVLKNTFQNEMKKMFVSLGMNSTFAESRLQLFPHRTHYYMADGNHSLSDNDIIDDLAIYEGYWPSAGIVSTAEDMLTFGSAMISAFKGKNKNFMEQSTVEELWTPEKTRITHLGENSNYCKGWRIYHFEEREKFPYKTMVWHSGGILGSSTILYLFPEENVVAIGFANRGYANELQEIVQSLAKDFWDFIN